jgi:hypothetical protein
MDLQKLRLHQFTTYNGFHLPQEFEIPLEFNEAADVYFVFLQSFEELNRFTYVILNKVLPKNNRVFYIYKKGQKHLHRDHIKAYIDRSPFLVMKAPMLCSLNQEYSCFTCMIKE